MMRNVVLVTVLAMAYFSPAASQGVCGTGQSCVAIASCPEVQALLAQPSPANIRRVQQLICFARRRNYRVCCSSSTGPNPIETSTPDPITTPSGPITTHSTPRPGGGRLPSDCGSTLSLDRVTFGDDAPVGGYPWMAAIGYQVGGGVEYRCGGAVINERYVLTAAHCLHTRYTRGLVASTVRLGEHDFSQSRDCSGRGYCNPPPQEFSIQAAIMHPQFNRRAPESDDIALVRLDRNVVFNDGVQPVCLPSAGQDVGEFLAGRDVVAAGWGTTEDARNSSVLQKVKLPFVSLEECRNIHQDLQFVPEQLCFGGRGRLDTCSGDSGGPVILDAVPRTVLGLVSKGKACGTPGLPAIYTDVASYRSWIEQTISP